MQRIASIVLWAERWILTVAVSAMATNTIANVFARNLLGRNIAASQEINEYLVVIVCFVGLSYGASQGRHIRMTAFYDQLGDTARRRLMIFINGSTSGLLFVLAWFGWSYASSVDRSSPVLGIPVQWVYFIVPLGLILGGIQYFLTMLRNARGDRPFIAFDQPDVHLDIEERGSR